MKAIIGKLTVFLSLALCVGGILGEAAMAQTGNESEAVAESQLLEIMLPGGAQRVLPESVPAEISQALEKVIAGSDGKYRQGETEVLLWGGGNYKKGNAPGIVNRLTANLKTAGWQYTVVGEENGITVYRASQGSPRPRTVVGFYGATDEALILAAMEIIPTAAANPANGSSDERTETEPSTAQIEKSPAGKNSPGGSVVGTWSDGYSSMWSGYVPSTGPKSYTPGRSHVFKYVFHPNGTYEFMGLMQNTIYSCTTMVFNDKRGRYTIDGNQITLTKTKNFFRRSDSCSAANFMERNHTLDTETYTFSVRRNKYGKEEVCFKTGDADACYERAQE